MKIIDVRNKEEYEAGHLNDAINFDLFDLMEGKLPDFDKGTEMILYCVSGGRSGRAKAILESAGFTNVQNGGGYQDLKAKGF